jgi:hypothetical protein
LVLSPDETIGNGNEWILFSERSPHILEPGGYIYRDQNSQATFNLYRDVSGKRISTGSYYMGMWIDSQNRQPESDEANNYSVGNNVITISNLRRLNDAAMPHESYNGNPLPSQVTWRKVELLQQPDGSRRLEILSDVEPTSTFAKTIRSADAVISPTVKRIPMPQASHVK